VLAACSRSSSLVTFVIGKGMLDCIALSVAAVNVTIAGTPEQLARGEHLASFVRIVPYDERRAAAEWRRQYERGSGMPLGELYPPNITPAGKLKELSDATSIAS
jgi:hypothetical protein